MVTGKIVMPTVYRFPTAVFLILFLFGCAGGNQNLYDWGRYEDSIHDMYLEPGKTTVADEILRLEEQIEKTLSAGHSVPPGLHAHLGYLYVTEGDYATAIIHFQTEKEKFPESAHFIDGMMERIKQ